MKRSFGTPQVVDLADWSELKASFVKRENDHTLAVICLPRFGYFAMRINHQGGAYKAHPVELALTLTDALKAVEKLAQQQGEGG